MSYIVSFNFFLCADWGNMYLSMKLHCTDDAPYPPPDLVARLIDSRTVRLQWKEPPLHGSPIVAYSVHYHCAVYKELQKVTRNTSIILSPLVPFTNYTFYVKAYNSDLYSDPSQLVSLFTGDDGMLTVLSNLSVVSYGSLPCLVLQC